jgi:8-oxo-dGTP diphosphatase
MSDTNFRIAVKSFIINEKSELLIIKRRDNDQHKPGMWDVPGGRLEPGENPFLGLIRETKEETSLNVEILNPLAVHHFTRDDGQIITMITFLCKLKTNKITLSKEHSEFLWCSTKMSFNKLHPVFRRELDLIENHFLKSI